MSRLFLGLPAPAKLNLFLHVTGRRADGYHELQSLMLPIALADTLDFELRHDGRVTRSGDVIGAVEQDLCLRAAIMLQQSSATAFGVDIAVEKKIPAGSGMGGGSSDAATTLLALNRLWNLGWTREQLVPLALRLGADVPFFLGAGAAFVEGIGERLTPVAWPTGWFAVVHPQVSVSTSEIFAAPDLTRATKAMTIGAVRYQRSGTGGASPLSCNRGRDRSPGPIRSGENDRFGFGGLCGDAVGKRRAGSGERLAARLARLGGEKPGCWRKGFALGSRQAG